MAPEAQQPQQQPKFSLFNVREWSSFIWNRVVRLPGIRRMQIGQVKVGERPHPVERELEKGWQSINDNLFNQVLRNIEIYWTKQGNLLGFAKSGDKESILGNPRGIASMYQRLGIYADIEKIPLETEWFRQGSGFVEEEIDYMLPENPREWSLFNWDNTKVRAHLNRTTGPATPKKIKRFKIYPSAVYHEGKKDLREELYCFGFENAKRIGAIIKSYDDDLNRQTLQEKRVEVEVRTKFTNAANAITELTKAIADIEEKQYEKLHGFEGEVKNWIANWDELVDKTNAPENSRTVILRFPHTYRIVKQSTTIQVEERIATRNRRGNIVERTLPRRAIMADIEFRDIYEEELREHRQTRDHLEQQKEEETRETRAKIMTLNRLVANRDVFANEVRQIMRRNEPQIRTIIESGENPTTKVERIIGIFTHDDPAINELFIENLRTVRLIEIVQQTGNTNNKLRRIETDLLLQFRANVLLRNTLTYEIGAFRHALRPTEEREDNRPRTHEEMFAEFKNSFLTYRTTYDIASRILDENAEAVMNIMRSNVSIDNKINQIGDIILRESDRPDYHIAKIMLALEIAQAMETNINQKYDVSISGHTARINEIENMTNREEILNEIRPRFNSREFYKRPEEVALGLDENGYPLEIWIKEDARFGEVLIDRWWHEISQNEWQLNVIANKPGGKEALQKHLGATVVETEARDEQEEIITDEQGNVKRVFKVTNSGSRVIRKMTDRRFHGRVDLLDAGIYIYCDWDQVRDDLRDGRYHSHCKSVADYVIEATGGFSERLGAPYPKGFGIWKSKGLFVSRKGIIPTNPINISISVNDLQDPITKLAKNTLIMAKPKDFKNVPSDEKAVTQNYVMRMPDGSLKKGVGSPSKYNPAFDRRAMNLPYIHWGRMYYYEWGTGVNRWSENPFPHISTRGIALYIAHLAASAAYNYQEAEQSLEGHPFDYGVRGQGKFGNVNPLSGAGILQEN